jgi:hypothetical protein
MLNNAQYDCEFTLHEYSSFKTISDIYASLAPSVDGFLISGNFALHSIEKSLNHLDIPISWFGIDLIGLYQLLLKQFIDQRNLDKDRVILDFLIPIRENPAFSELLESSQITSIKTDIELWLHNSSLTDLYNLEENIAQKIESLWNQNKLDLVVCCFSSIMPILEAKGIPSIFAYPSTGHIDEVINNLIATIKLKQMRENLPVVISLSKKEKGISDDSDLNTVSLQKSILNFNKENMTNFLLQKNGDNFDIYTSLKITNHITHFLKSCQLSDYFAERLDFQVFIGYGIGNTISEAKENAMIAKSEAILTGGSFIMDENRNLIGPLGHEHYMEITDKITPELRSIAEQSKLSTLTLQKVSTVLKLMGTNQITTVDLATRLNVTVRNANRILNNLESSGFATIQHNKFNGTKGRPVKVYQVNI